jgi:threonine dehydratase
MAITQLEEIEAAAAFVRGRVHRTPLLSSLSLKRSLRDGGRPEPARASLKAESLQKTGSFKVRGVLNRIRTLDPEERRRGLVTISAGNHAAALAWGASAEGVACTVVMPANADPSKVEASRAYGAEVILHGTPAEAFKESYRLRDEQGLTFIHPFNDAGIIAGAGTVGLEIMQDEPEVDVVVVPIGGGGLISGVAAAVRGVNPHARVYGVEPVGAACMKRALEAGRVVQLEKVDTLAGGLAPPFVGELTLEHAQALLSDVVLVTDDELLDGMRFVADRARLVVEPSGAAAVAALLLGRIPVADGENVVAVLSGGNVGLDRLSGWLRA